MGSYKTVASGMNPLAGCGPNQPTTPPPPPPFNSYPHIALVKLELALPFPHLDRDGSIPVLASVEFNNPNAFRVRTEPATVKVGLWVDGVMGGCGCWTELSQLN